jgi:hypothetical protein
MAMDTSFVLMKMRGIVGSRLHSNVFAALFSDFLGLNVPSEQLVDECFIRRKIPT